MTSFKNLGEALENGGFDYIRLIYKWSKGFGTKYAQIQCTGGGSLVTPIVEIDPDYSYIGTYVTNEDKDRFAEWIEDYAISDEFEDLYIDTKYTIYGSDGDHIVSCLIGEIEQYDFQCPSEDEFKKVSSFDYETLPEVFDDHWHHHVEGME